MTWWLACATAAPVEVSAGYYGHLATHPGAFVAVEYAAASHGPHRLFVGLRGAGYTHPGNHVGLLLRPELGYRATATLGPFVEVSAGPAYFHRLLSGAVYREGGSRGLDAGRPGFAPGGGLGLGWELDELRLRVTGRAEGWMVTPVNRGWRAGAAVSLGLTWLGPS